MRKRRKSHGKPFSLVHVSPSTAAPTLTITDDDGESSAARLDSKDEDSSSARLSETTMANDTVPTWTQCGGQVRKFHPTAFRQWALVFFQDLHATPNSKAVTPEETADSSTMIKKDCLTSRTVLAGAVVPEESSHEGSISNDDIENRTKIMMHFMDDLTNIYFSTRNSLKLTVENGAFEALEKPDGDDRRLLHFRWIMEWK